MAVGIEEEKPSWYGTGEGRGPGGLFAKNNRGGPGNPHAKRTHALRRLILDTTSDEDAKEVWQSIIVDAKAGDPVARKLFCDYVFGKPVTPIAVSAVDEGQNDDQSLIGRIEIALGAFPEARLAVARVLCAPTIEASTDGPSD